MKIKFSYFVVARSPWRTDSEIDPTANLPELLYRIFVSGDERILLMT